MRKARLFGLLISILLPSSSAFSDDAVTWTAKSDFGDGRRLLTDGSIILDSNYVAQVPAPEKSIPPANIGRFLESPTDREFGLGDLTQPTPGGHYIGPGPIQLNRKYIDLLKSTPFKSSLKFRAKGPMDPVVIFDGEKVAGAMMPMKM